MAKKVSRTCQLTTPFEENAVLNWQEYPRPQFKRDSYISLCGVWQLAVKKADDVSHLGDITVPYPPESRISGIGRNLEKGEQYIYTKKFNIEDKFNVGKVLLHFGAADQLAKVWINNSFVGEHIGGYLPFSFDITACIKNGENEIKVEVTDNLDIDFSFGKQRYDRGGMWYTPISGIWQPVWLESVPHNHIENLRISLALDCVTLEVAGGNEQKNVVINTPDGKVEHSFAGNKTTIKIDNPVNWTPENPYLYTFTITSGDDTVESYFALRTITIEKVKGQSYICLNGKPYFFHGLLDQGYYSDGIYTPASPDGYVWDILKMKELGFNMLRKHIKIEPDLFYYFCDKYGMIVFQDMLNAGKYNYIIDTALPTIGFKKGFRHTPTPKRREFFEKECRAVCDLLYNHPSVCYYTIFNEGWGQYEADRIYRELKQYEPSRIWDATSGWFIEKESDVVSEHIYFRKIKLKPNADRPLVLSEFGGYSYKVEGHSFNLDDNYGYKTFDSAQNLTDGLCALYKDDIVNAIKNGLCATVLTQVSDVEDETNGLVTYDRNVVKTDKAKMLDMAQTIFAVFREKTE